MIIYAARLVLASTIRRAVIRAAHHVEKARASFREAQASVLHSTGKLTLCGCIHDSPYICGDGGDGEDPCACGCHELIRLLKAKGRA